jgi:hypothetical protein
MAIAGTYHNITSGTQDHDTTVTVANNSDRILAIIFTVYGVPANATVNVRLDPTGSNEYATQVSTSNTGAFYGHIYRIVNPTPGTDLALRVRTSTTALYVSTLIVDMYDMDTSSITDGYSVGTGTSADPTATVSSSAAGGHITSMFCGDAASGPSVDTWSGVTGQTTKWETDHGGHVSAGAYATQTSSGSFTADFTQDSSDAWVCPLVIWPVATASTDDLTASDVTSGTPTIDAPAIGNPDEDTLLSSDITTGTPTLDTPTIARNLPPTTAPNTADLETFNDTTPTLEFTATDALGEDVSYQIQISESSNFDDTVGIEDTNTATGVGIVHPNPLTTATTWEGEIQVDDRPGQSFTGAGGILDHIDVYFGSDVDTDGYMYVRVYAHEGTYGTSSQPLNAPASSSDTPTAGWLAESTHYYIDTSRGTTPIVQACYFTGDDRILLENGTYYVVIVDWLPADRLYDNTIRVSASGTVHAGNMWIDGDSANYGVFPTADLRFSVYEATTLIDALSDTDAGFANTVTGGDTDPFNSGEKVSYTVQGVDELSTGTYYWHARATDPNGSGEWGAWTTTRSFTITTSDTLTASDVTSGTPTVDSSTIGQVHALTASDVISGVPTLDTPTLGQSHVLTSSDVTSGVPTIDTPSLAQIHTLTSSDVLSGTPTIDASTIAQIHVLTVTDVTSGTPTIDAPTVGQIHALSTTDVSASAVTIDSATLYEATFLRPNSDITVGSWSPTSGNDLFAMLDEVTPNDSDYVYSEDAPVSSVAEVGLQSGIDPAVSDAHVVRYRYHKSGSGTINLTFYLMEGVTQRATWAHNNISVVVAEGEYILSAAEADSITDYSALRIRWSATEV